ncbi:MAG: peptidoglycan-binding domain-containing protein [Candidatus Promineifilaceae bacterium]|nr:peptidoglycan-binding domain-containing protein [Candidatus Promineifilaceae bacterium]
MTVRRGDRGEQVKRIQQALKDAGFDIVVDGDFGKQTEAVVKEFQGRKGLSLTVSLATRRVLLSVF